MYPFVESVKYLDGKHYNLAFHQQRFNFTRNAHYQGCETINLEELLVEPSGLLAGQVYKCRVIYGKEVSEIIYEPYTPRRIAQYYLAVCHNEADYTFKLTDRSFFDKARKKLGPNEDFIYVRKGLITDTSYANLVFTDGVRYITPASPLLKGTKRAQYLSQGIIQEEDIKVKDIQHFRSFFVINAMLDMDPAQAFSCDNLLLSQIQPGL